MKKLLSILFICFICLSVNASEIKNLPYKNIKENEHPCKLKEVEEKPNVIYEDYVREDNSRYEEKD